MNHMQRRVIALEGPGKYLTLGQMLDSLAGEPLPEGLTVDPIVRAALDALPKWGAVGGTGR